MLYQILCTGFLLLTALLGKISAQAVFSEGILTYRIDTVRRLETHPAAYKVTQFKLYKKGDLVRVEKRSINMFDSTDRQLMIEIRNKKGIYTLLETRSMPIDFAQFTSYEDEKRDRSTAALKGHLKSYTVKRTGQKSVLLSMPTEKLIITSSDESDSIETQVTKSINAPVKLFFEPFRRVEDTPLQFTESQYGWLNRYTIESVTSQYLSNELFQIDPKLKVMTTEQMLKELGDFK
jgi:hypothetical protein